MSNFDVSLLPALPDGGAGAISSGAFGGSPGEAPPDAFAQLLEELAGEAALGQMGLTGSGRSDAPAADAELDTVALSESADGWERGESTTVPGSSGEEENQDVLAPVALMAMIAPIVLPETAEASSAARAVKRNGAAGTEAAATAADEPPDVSEDAATKPVPGDQAETLFDVAAGSKNHDTRGTLEGRTVETLPGADPGAADEAGDIHLDRARVAAIEHAATHSRTERTGTDAENGAGPARGANAARADRTSAAESRTSQATPPVAAESPGDAGRRQGSREEQQPGLATRTYEGIGAEPSGQPVSVGQAFSQAVAAAAQSAGAVTEAGGVVSAEANALESQIVQGMQRLRRGGVEEIRVTLRPEYLGALTISLRVEHDSVTAVMHVDEPQVRAWVQSHESQLRQAMSSQGLTLERLVVTDERPGSDTRERNEQARQKGRPNRRRDEQDPTPLFEVVG